MPDTELIKQAQAVAGEVVLGANSSAGAVGCALLTDKGTLFSGVCIETPCGMGFCAEHNAIGSMITAGEKNITTIVAVTPEGQIYPPCGRCREFITQVSDDNTKTRVILSPDKSKTIAELLPDAWVKS